VQCDAEEDMGGMSKGNEGQADLVRHIVKMLTTPANDKDDDALTKVKITALSPYSKQIKQLKTVLPQSVPAFTIDSFQGRESDIIIFSSVRCNTIGEIGFLEDARRLNVMWTRAKLALIIVGDRRTMTEGSQLWKRAIESCTPVPVSLPEEIVVT
jgi:regulator of nonsense transcripts 1